MRKISVKRILIPLLAALLTLFLMRYVFFVGAVPTSSMEPTIHKGSFIFAVRLFSELNEGDIVIFEHGGKLCVKRIASVGPGKFSFEGKTYDVPKDQLFMLGDNTGYSFDSRYWAEPFVGKDEIKAKLFDFTREE